MKASRITILFIILFGGCSSTPTIPITILSGSDPNKPLLFYITGDGGWDHFSNTLTQDLCRKGYSIIGLNAERYFWNKKTPRQAANEISTYLRTYLAKQQTKHIVFIGYSFGADVIPFMEQHLSSDVLQALQRTLLISPNQKTDFEIHLFDDLDIYGGQSVPNEISRITMPVTIVFGTNEKGFAIKRTNAMIPQIVRIAGDHHYNGNIAELVRLLSPWLH